MHCVTSNKTTLPNIAMFYYAHRAPCMNVTACKEWKQFSANKLKVCNRLKFEHKYNNINNLNIENGRHYEKFLMHILVRILKTDK